MFNRQLLVLMAVVAMVVMAVGLVSASALSADAGDLFPGGLSAESTVDGVALSWDAPTQDSESVTGYRILRHRPDEGEKRLLKLVADTGATVTAFVDDDVEVGVRYNYRVRALRGAEYSKFSNLAKLTHELVEPPAPSPVPVTEIVPDDTDTSTWTENELRPSGLLATAGLGLVTLSWDAPAGDAASVDGYEILRRRTNRGEKALTTLVADTGATDTLYLDSTANEEGVKYAYRVKALRGGVASMWSMFANATGIANTVTFVEEPQTQSEPQPAVVQLDAVCAAAPETELSAWDAMLGPPAIPVDVSATSAPGGMSLSWDGGASEVTGFRVWRAEVGAEDCMSLLIADTASSDTAFVDGDVSDGAVYGYRIQALRDTAVSEWSQWVHHTYLLSEAELSSQSGNQIEYVPGDPAEPLVSEEQHEIALIDLTTMCETDPRAAQDGLRLHSESHEVCTNKPQFDFPASILTEGRLVADGATPSGYLWGIYGGQAPELGILLNGVSGGIDMGWSADSDWYAIRLTSGTEYQIDMLGYGDGTDGLADKAPTPTGGYEKFAKREQKPVLTLRNANGDVLRSDGGDLPTKANGDKKYEVPTVGSGTGANARITYTARRTGTHYVEATFQILPQICTTTKPTDPHHSFRWRSDPALPIRLFYCKFPLGVSGETYYELKVTTP